MLLRSLGLDVQGLHQATHFVTAIRKALHVELNLYTHAAISGLYIGMDVPNSGTQLGYVSINGFRRCTAIICGAGMTQIAANVGHVKISLLQCERDDLLLAYNASSAHITPLKVKYNR